MFFSIDHARFIYRQLLAAPRLRDVVAAVSPQIEGKLLYLRTADGVERTVRASADIPSLTAAVGAAPTLLAGAWTDDSLDRRWRAPTAARAAPRHRSLPPAARRGAGRSELGGVALLQRDHARPAAVGVHHLHARRRGRRHARAGGAASCSSRCTSRGGPRVASRARVPSRDVRFSTTDADLRIGEARVDVLRRRTLRAARHGARGGHRHAGDARSRRRAGRRCVLPGRVAHERHRQRLRRAGAARRRHRLDLRRRDVHAVRRARRRITITTGASGAASPGSGARRAPATYTFLYGRVESADSVDDHAARSSSISSIGRDFSRSSARATSATSTDARRASAA